MKDLQQINNFHRNIFYCRKDLEAIALLECLEHHTLTQAFIHSTNQDFVYYSIWVCVANKGNVLHSGLIWQWKQLYYSGLFDFRFDIRSICSTLVLRLNRWVRFARSCTAFRLRDKTAFVCCMLWMHSINSISSVVYLEQLKIVCQQYFYIFQSIVRSPHIFKQ